MASVSESASKRERISLGIKQLYGDAFNDYIKENAKGSRVIGKVIDITEEKIILNLSEMTEIAFN